MDASTGVLRLTSRWQHGTVTVTVGGELDIATAGQLRAHAEEALLGHAQQIVLEMSEVSFIDASGLRVLVGLAAKADRGGTEMLLGEVSPTVTRLLKITGLDGRFPSAPRGVPRPGDRDRRLPGETVATVNEPWAESVT